MAYRVEETPATQTYHEVTCDGCGRDLKQVGPSVASEEGWAYLQPDDGLEIHLSGGYAMFIDPFDAHEDDLTILYCVECAKNLCDSFPAFKRVVARYISSNIGHCCSLKGNELVWEGLWNCDCQEEERRQERASHNDYLSKAISKHGVHRFAPNPSYQNASRQPCAKCGWLAIEGIHDNASHLFTLTSLGSCPAPSLISTLYNWGRLEMQEAKEKVEILIRGETLEFEVFSDEGSEWFKDVLEHDGIDFQIKEA
jgi:hypothetical protein